LFETKNNNMRYALTIKGRVQNAGYRNLIEKNARVNLIGI